MGYKAISISFTLFIFVCIIQSCSSTKYVPEGEYWLQSANVKNDNKTVSTLDIEPYIRQKGNFKTLALFRLPLFIYNLSGADTTKWINRTLRKGGEPPVIYDSTLVGKTVGDIIHFLGNKGYIHAKVTPEIKKGKKKVNVSYLIESGTPYRITNYRINIPDSVLSDTIVFRSLYANRERKITDLNNALQRNTLIKEQATFNLDVLDEERSRISSLLRRYGYYDFNKEYIGFIADTIAGKNLVDLELTIYPYMEKTNSGIIIENPHQQLIVKDVNFYVDHNPLEDGDIKNYVPSDIVYRQNGGYKIYYGKRGNYIKPSVITNNCFIRPEALYNENATTMTYNALSRLHILKNVNIRYEKISENDSIKLRCIITCVPDKKQGISAEIEGTNSAGAFGIGAGIGYTHRNIFKGSELFNVKIQGAYEALNKNSFAKFDKNYFEIGGEMSISFPRFMFPFLSKDTKRRMQASTQLTSNYIFQRRPDYFTRTVLSARLGYIWQNRRVSPIRHSIDLIDVSYIRIPQLTQDFENKLTLAAKVYSFTDQFILGTGYTYTNSTFDPTRRRKQASAYSFRTNVQTAGNLLSLIATVADIKKDADEGKKIFNTRYSQYILGNVDYSHAITLDEKNSIAWRIGGGLAYPYGNNKLVPIQKRFFSGGANSVRGWNIRELGPGSLNKENPDFYQQSGDIRFDANIEYRSKVFWRIELAAFLDAGNIWTVKEYENQERGVFKFKSFYKEIAAAWGLGFRFDFDYVLIRFDTGWKLYNPANKYKEMKDGTFAEERKNFKWPVLRPFDFGENVTWHIAVGYPF